MKLILILPAVFTVINARPEAPIRVRQAGIYPPGPPPLAIAQQLPIGPPIPPPIRNNFGPPAQTYGPPSLQPIVTKNIYVHLPPDDDEPIRQPQVFPAIAPKKHYKLIFIKAPEPPRFQAPVVPPNVQDEHKTLVYVLVKKPDDQPQVELPSIVPTEPSKPEVYFIKYKANSGPAPAQGYGPPGPPPIAPNPQYGPPGF